MAAEDDSGLDDFVHEISKQDAKLKASPTVESASPVRAPTHITYDSGTTPTEAAAPAARRNSPEPVARKGSAAYLRAVSAAAAVEADAAAAADKADATSRARAKLEAEAEAEVAARAKAEAEAEAKLKARAPGRRSGWLKSMRS